MAPALISRVPGLGQYWGHTPGQPGQVPEPLTDHVNLVVQYALKLIEIHHLEPVIDNLVHQLAGLFSGHVSDRGRELLKAQVLDVWEYHDYGKINPAFQSQRMQNPAFGAALPQAPFQHFHSGQGAAIFVVSQAHNVLHADPRFEEEEAYFLIGISLLLAMPIFWHHSGGIYQPYEKWKREELGAYWDNLESYLKAYGLPWEEEMIKTVWERRNDLLEHFPIRQNMTGVIAGLEQTFPLYLLLKLTFSLLTASDYLATAQYMQGSEDMLSDMGVLSREDKQGIVDAFRHTTSYNQALIEGYERFLDIDPTASELQSQSNTNLNLLRQSMAAQVRRQVNDHAEKRLFYLEAPTGGGKTNLSMLALAELLARDLVQDTHEITKVFYVFPFTTLVTQTYTGLIETLGLREGQIAELHSRAGLPEKEKEQAEDGLYGSDKLNYLHYLFGHYPVTVMTHVRFFNLLKTHRKEPNYQHHRLANSLVIIDELQSYPPKEWSRMLDFIAQYARLFNMRFVLMSATLPKLHLLQHSQVEVVPLLPNSKAYFRNPNFGQRCSFNLDLLKKYGKIDLEVLAGIIHEKAMAHAAMDGGKAKPLGSVYAMVEFIFKRRATELAQYLEATGLARDFDHIFVLSGTILEPRRKEIIAFLKNTKNRQKKILLITTQVVEAGVDIDMDLGFKDTSLVDSDEQLAGRINRNVKKQGSILYLFNLDRAAIIYKEDLRYEYRPKPEEHARILREKDFDRLYAEVLEKINRDNQKIFTQGIEDYRRLFSQLNFPEIDYGFKLIDAKNATVFVPLNLPTHTQGTQLPIFSASECDWLKAQGMLSDRTNLVSGEKVWERYEQLVENREGGFIQRQIDVKRLQAIMSRFSFQLMADSRAYDNLKVWGEEKLGYLYLLHYAGYEPQGTPPIYDYQLGILDQNLDNGNIL